MTGSWLTVQPLSALGLYLAAVLAAHRCRPPQLLAATARSYGHPTAPGGAARLVRCREGQMAKQSEIVCVQTYSRRLQAELAKGRLEAHGIAALVQADDMGGMSDLPVAIMG